MIEVRLWDHVGTGLILELPTGVRYSNQVAGVACEHPVCEGIFLPLGNDLDPADQLLGPQQALSELFDSSGNPPTMQQADRLDVLLARLADGPFHQLTLVVDREQLANSREAWVHVVVACDEPAEIVRGVAFPAKAVLTWCNSD
jgi:hypothetical protein